MLQSSWSFLQSLASALFAAELPRSRRWVAWVWLLGLYLAGLLWFWIFFQKGTFTLEFEDWSQITAPRLQFLRTALKDGELPLHISDPKTFQGKTTRYLAVPDTLISPQLILLYWLPVQWFAIADTWILYSLGFVGLLLLRARFKLSLIPFTALVFLFNFNGNILAHLAVGHFSWGGYFLFPWFAWLIYRLLDGDRSWLWTLGMALVLFAIWLQGSYHQFAWLLLLLGLVGLLVPRTFWTVLRTGAAVLLACAFRILPAILINGVYSSSFDNGFPTLWALWVNLVNFSVPNQATNFFYMGTGPQIGNWELTTFVGMAAALFLLYFGVYRGLLARRAPFRELALPVGIIFLLCNGSFYDLVSQLNIPLLNGERITARMISVVLVFVLIAAVERFQRWLDESDRKPFLAAGSLLVFAMTGMDLWLNLNVWRITHAKAYFQFLLYDKNLWFVQNDWTDSTYLWLVFGGLAISVLAFGVLVWLAWRERGGIYKAHLRGREARGTGPSTGARSARTQRKP
jgi:hypothetical protein